MSANAFDLGAGSAVGSEGKGVARKAGAAGRLTDRDRQLMGLLAIARYLTTEQLGRLFFPGRHPETTRKRLSALGTAADGKHQYLRRLQYRTFENELVAVWALTSTGYAIAESATGSAHKIPRADVSPAFLEHSIKLNELLVALLEGDLRLRLAQAKLAAQREQCPDKALDRLKGEIYTTARLSGFTWSASETVRLPWKEYGGINGKTHDRAIVPDAVLAVPAKRLRFFLEFETGSHSIEATSDEKSGATIAKVERYERFITGSADLMGRATFYSQAYPDGFVPELLFIVETEGRKRSVNDRIAIRARNQGRPPLRCRAVLPHETPAIFGAATVATSGHVSTVHARSLEAEDFSLIKTFYAEAINALNAVRVDARARGVAVPDYPVSAEAMRSWIVLRSER